MSNVNESTEKVLLHHLEALSEGDVDKILSDYTAESVLVTPEATLRGAEAMRPMFEMFTSKILPAGSDFSMVRQVVEGEHAYVLWKGASPKFDIPLGTDTFTIRDGKIVFQTFAGQIVPKK